MDADKVIAALSAEEGLALLNAVLDRYLVDEEHWCRSVYERAEGGVACSWCVGGALLRASGQPALHVHNLKMLLGYGTPLGLALQQAGAWDGIAADSLFNWNDGAPNVRHVRRALERARDILQGQVAR